MRNPSIAGAFILLALSPAAAHAAVDQNGYTARYECRAGSPNCNVDVAALGKRACDQVIAPSDPWSRIDWSNNTICLAAGDHASKGTLTVPSSANGSPNSYKVLRYYRPGDFNDDPWKQTNADKAKIAKIEFHGSYWLVDRVTLDGGGADSSNNISGGHNIFNRILVQNYNWTMFNLYGTKPYNTLQNSVLRNSGRRPHRDTHCIDTGYSPDYTRIVNNEIYDCAGDGFQTSQGSAAVGFVIENNDIYQTTALRADGSGRLTQGGNYSCGENAIDLKSGGTAANPLKVIHNRFWGFRWTDMNCGSTGSGGEAVVLHADNSHGLIQDNIIWNVPYAISASNPSPSRYSVIGNLIFDSKHSPYSDAYTITLAKASSTEIYLNTIISATKAVSIGNGTTNDARCNVIISSGESNGTSSQFNDNGYYSSPHANESRRIGVSVANRGNGATYSVGQIIQTSGSGNCVKGSESACYLYRVISAGTTAATAPAYCTELGCVQNDGGVQLRAIRGPYSFYAKLRTSPTRNVIPYARAFGGGGNEAEIAPEAYSCPTDYAARYGVGINDN